jgi:hypothetical protein
MAPFSVSMNGCLTQLALFSQLYIYDIDISYGFHSIVATEQWLLIATNCLTLGSGDWISLSLQQ